MGRAKRDWEARIARGHDYVGGKSVCSNCFEDYAIHEFINKNAVEQACDYCGNRSSEPIAAPLEDVIDFLLEGIGMEWDDPVNCVGWEDGWVGVEVIDSDELIRDRVGLEDSNEEVLQDIINSIWDREWCQRDPYGLRTEEALTFSWHSFCEQVKHHSRYIFFRMGDEEGHFYDLDEIPASKMLDRISWEMSRLEYDIDIIKLIDAGTRLRRVRIHGDNEVYNTAKDLGTVSLEGAKYSNRMSPAGISMFYGAFDPETALKETIDREIELGKVASIATFKTLRGIRVLDLSELPRIPSLFDPKKRYMRSSLMFMHNFVADLSKSVTKDNLEHVDYVPTQIFTEYIRYLYTDIEGNRILGIVYPSARNAGGKAVVLFLENEHCCDEYQYTLDNSDSEAPKYLLLDGVERRPLNETN